MRALIISALLSWSTMSFAAITVDRSRVIVNESEKNVSVILTNADKNNPYLVQSWIEDDTMNKLPMNASPLVVLPPVMRLDQGQKSALRITPTAMASRLPSDRESLLYLNVREVPPKKVGDNVLQVALQTTIKLLYRPKRLERRGQDFNGNQLKIMREGEFLNVDNPTPYYFTIVGMSSEKNDTYQQGFDVMTLQPYGKVKIKNMLKQEATSLWVTFINDYGGRPQMNIPLI